MKDLPSLSDIFILAASIAADSAKIFGNQWVVFGFLDPLQSSRQMPGYALNELPR